MELRNERLQVTFAKPGEIPTQRFDNTAIVTQVVLDGKYSFCTPEQVISLRRSTYGVGLCGEFVLDGAAEAAKAGEWFCKPGVGLLRQREDFKPYDMWQTYESQPFAVEESGTHTERIFRQRGTGSGSYGIEIEKSFRLLENALILNIAVKNTGTLACVLQEYQHNFVAPDMHAVGPGYVLHLPCDVDLQKIEGRTLHQGDERPMPSAVRACDGNVCWTGNMDGLVLYHRSENICSRAKHLWKLQHLESGVSVQEQVDFCPSRIDVWAVEHCICPEFYYHVQLAPGEQAHWRRTWTFSCGD